MKIREQIGLLFTLGLFVFLFLHFNWGRMDGIDAHIFTAMGYHMMEGQQLYVDIWESKPINIYLINALAFKVFGVKYSSIWLVQLLNGVLACFFCFKLIQRITLDRHLSLLGTLFFMWLFYFAGLYYSGNCTEEFGVTALIAGLFFLHRSWTSDKRRDLWLSGFCMSMAFWFKEPFLFSMAPWLVYSGFRLVQSGKFKPLWFLILGLATPFIIYFSYFILSGSIDEVYKTFIYNREYTRFMGLTFQEKIGNGWKYFVEYMQYRSVLVPFLPLLALPALYLSKSNKSGRVVLILLLIQMGFELLSISLSGLTVTHYYLQIVPTLVLGSIVAMYLIINKLKFRARLIIKGVMIGLILNGLFNIHLEESPKQERYTEVVSYLNENRNDGDKLFVENAWHGALYVMTKMQSDCLIPTPLFHYFMIQDRYNNERVASFVRSLKTSPPRFILVSKERGILKNHTDLNSWFYLIYQEGKSFDVGGDELTLYELSLP